MTPPNYLWSEYWLRSIRIGLGEVWVFLYSKIQLGVFNGFGDWFSKLISYQKGTLGQRLWLFKEVFISLSILIYPIFIWSLTILQKKWPGS